MNSTRLLLAAALFTLCAGWPANTYAAKYTLKPSSDFEDGQLVDGTAWDWRSGYLTVPDLLLTLGRVDGVRYDLSLLYLVPALGEAQTVEDVRLQLNEQGGNLAAGLTVEISGAMTLDPLSATGAERFALPRTAARVTWNVAADWDSSGQLIAKYEETPDVSAILNEIASQPGWDASAHAAIFFLEVVSPSSGTAFVRTDDTHSAFIGGGNAGIRPVRLVVSETLHDTFYGKEMLCRPAPGSVRVNVIPRFTTDAYVEWGTDGTTFPESTAPFEIAAGDAKNFPLTGLPSDAHISYRLRFRRAGAGDYETGPTRSFTSMPAELEEARLCVTSDIHVTNTTAQATQPDLDLLAESLDFMKDHAGAAGYHLWMDLGDLVVIRATRVVFDEEEAEQRYREAREWVDRIGHSVPLVFVRGNHEEVNGWDDNGTPNSTMIWSGKLLMKYLQPPLPNAYVSGNETPHPNLGVPANYFAFTIGRLRVRCLDPYLYSSTRPHNGHGETGGSLNGWDWSLGEGQYLWLRDDLAQHPAPFSLVALHHLTSCYTGAGQYYGRGGVEIAKFSVANRPTFEWGGEDTGGGSALATQRPGYVEGPVHDVLVNRGNQVVLKGHDHFHARQSLGGMTYVTLAKPDDTGVNTGNRWGWRYFSFYPEEITFFAPNSGFLSIAAGETSATYSYIQTYPTAGRGTVLDSFTVFADPVGVGELPLEAAAARTAIDVARPNPTGGETTFEFQIGRSTRARLEVIDAAGRLVRVVADEVRSAGRHEARWDGRDASGKRVASGVYFARLVAGDDRVDSVKMIVLR